MAKKTPKKTVAAKTATKKAGSKKAADQTSQSEEISMEATGSELESEPEETSILLRKFKSSWQPETTYKVELPESSGNFIAPPFTDDENVRKLLFLKFDISAFPADLTPENKKKQEEALQKMAEAKEKRKAEFAAMMKAAGEQARIKAEEEARKKAEEEARIKAEEEARKKAEKEARIKAEEEARKKAEEEARIKAEEEARKKAEEEAKIKAEEEARKKAEEEARIKAEEEARKKAEEEAKIKAEEEARKKAEEEAKIKAEEEARKKAEEEARIKAEEEARKKAEEEARIKAEEEARKKAEEEARIKAEEEARKKALEEARLAAEVKAVENAKIEARKRLEEYEKQAPKKVCKSVKKESGISNGLVAAGIIFVMLVGLICFKSAVNSTRYYVKTYSDGIEIWQGNFSPKGSSLIADLQGAKKPEVINACYSKNEIAPMIFAYYLGLAEKQLKIQEPELAKASAEKAIEFAVDTKSMDAANKCIVMVNFMKLLEKADGEMAKGTYAGIQNAITMMAKTPKYDLEDAHVVIIESKINAAKAQLAELKKISGSRLMSAPPKKVIAPETVQIGKTEKEADIKHDLKSEDDKPEIETVHPESH